MLLPSFQELSVIIVGLFFLWLFIPFRFAGTTLIQDALWRRRILTALLANIVGFTTVSLIFFFTYGWITDDINYWDGGLNFPMSFFELKSGGQFMFYIVRPFREYFDFSIPAFHIMFATMGFSGSLNYFYVLFRRAEAFGNKNSFYTKMGFWILLCFPNFLTWGRIFGKDSTMFFLASLFNLGVFKMVYGLGNPAFNFLVLIFFPLYIMQIIRPHIAGVLGICFLIAWAAKINLTQHNRHLAIRGIIVLYLPVILAASLGGVGYFSLRKMVSSNQDIDIESVQETIISASQMGAYGHSKTQLASDVKENPKIIFTPKQIMENIFNLFFAPMPWKIRGFADFLAVVSNILLFLFLLNYGRSVHLYDIYQTYLFFCVLGLTLLLSFLAVNAGLVMRQKTIILPFLFLLLFSRPPTERDDEAS